MTQDIENTSEIVEAPAARRRPVALGRGLNALLGDVVRDLAPVNAAGDAPIDLHTDVRRIAISSIRPHPGQPRRHFDEAQLAELAASIATRGLIQPVLVRPAPDGVGYQLVAGERRWRAAQAAGLHEIPAIVRSLNDAQTLEIALVENIQRADLTAIEEAQAFAKLAAEFGHTQEALAALVGKSRSHVANLLRLLGLPDPVQAALAAGTISMGHARALINATDPVALLALVVKGGLSVRATEALVRKSGAPDAKANTLRGVETKSIDPDIAALESNLGDLLGLKISILHNAAGHGQLTLCYSTMDQLDWLCQRISGEKI